MLFSSPSLAETKQEYDQKVEAAKAKLSAAQTKYDKTKSLYENAINTRQSIASKIVTAQEDLQNKATAFTAAQNEVLQAQQNLATAQTNYNTNLISDPNWIRPTKEVQVSEQVSYTVLVPHTETVTQTTLVPRTVTTTIPGGLVAESYDLLNYGSSPVLPDSSTLVFTETVNNISFDWGGGNILSSGLSEHVAVKFTGNIQLPLDTTYGFYAPGDDGIIVIIDGNTIINDWYDKGGGGSQVYVDMAAGNHTITVWYYENGGGANIWLYWQIPGGAFDIVPATAFGQQTIETTVYDEVTTTTDVTTYTEVIKYKIIWHTETVPDDSASAPLIYDPALLQLVNQAQAVLDKAEVDLATAQSDLDNSQATLNDLLNQQTSNDSSIDSLSTNLVSDQQAVTDAQLELESINPYVEPTSDPTQTTEITEPTPSETPSSISKQAEVQLEERSVKNDTGVLPYTVADVVTELQAEQVVNIISNPEALVGAVGAQLEATGQFIGELVTNPAAAISAVADAVSQAGLDMSNDQREKAQEVIIPVIIVSNVVSSLIGRIK